MKPANLPMADINPYAAPSVPDPLLPDRGPPAGPWRDGLALVIHRLGGALPHVCLRTGQPADVRRRVQIRWSYPIDYSMRDTIVEVGLTLDANRSNRRWELATTLAIIVSIVGTIAVVVTKDQLARPLFLSLLAPSVMIGVWGLIASYSSRLLRFAKARGEYIWLRGAHPDFLACLPEWPGRR